MLALSVPDHLSWFSNLGNWLFPSSAPSHSFRRKISLQQHSRANLIFLAGFQRLWGQQLLLLMRIGEFSVGLVPESSRGISLTSRFPWIYGYLFGLDSSLSHVQRIFENLAAFWVRTGFKHMVLNCQICFLPSLVWRQRQGPMTDGSCLEFTVGSNQPCLGELFRVVSANILRCNLIEYLHKI